MSLRRALVRHINVIVFCICFTLVYGFHFGLWIWYRARKDDLEAAAVEWVVCNSGTGGRNDCELTFGLSLPKMYFQIGVTSCSGLFIFLSWGCSPRYLDHWRRKLIPLILTGQFRQI